MDLHYASDSEKLIFCGCLNLLVTVFVPRNIFYVNFGDLALICNVTDRFFFYLNLHVNKVNLKT